MKVSIITASYNSEKELEATYQSIVAQTHSDWEWVVTDDCSNDKSVNVLARIAATDSRVKFYKNSSNSGAAISRNNSILHSSGDFLAFLDSDDLWYPNKLAIQIAAMEEKRVNFSFTAYELIDESDLAMNKTVDSCHSGFFTYNDMLKKKATLGCSTVMLRRSAFKRISMPNIRTGQDYATWLGILKQGENAYLIDSVLTKYRIRSSSISRNKFKKAKRQWSIYRSIEQLPINMCIYYFIFYAWRAVFRKA
ncbi:glycosyltransferase family 2 protein [Aeromonas caviae]|uniref:glycosyltransferase family 2 protein n=1 Tax=Aeromonas caviae TaxID=648 RepID=UPI003F74333C